MRNREKDFNQPQREGGLILLRRLRAALTPQALVLLLALALVFGTIRTTDKASKTPLEVRAGQALSAVEGAGKVDVTIVMREGKRGSLTGTSGEETPCGAVAVAEGADDPLVEMQLTQALCALLGLPASAVSVMMGGR